MTAVLGALAFGCGSSAPPAESVAIVGLVVMFSVESI